MKRDTEKKEQKVRNEKKEQKEEQNNGSRDLILETGGPEKKIGLW